MNATTMGYGIRARERMPFAWAGVTRGLAVVRALVSDAVGGRPPVERQP